MSKASVIVPTYNQADMVGDAIQSVLDQTYADWELIVILREVQPWLVRPPLS